MACDGSIKALCLILTTEIVALALLSQSEIQQKETAASHMGIL